MLKNFTAEEIEIIKENLDIDKKVKRAKNRLETYALHFIETITNQKDIMLNERTTYSTLLAHTPTIKTNDFYESKCELYVTLLVKKVIEETDFEIFDKDKFISDIVNKFHNNYLDIEHSSKAWYCLLQLNQDLEINIKSAFDEIIDHRKNIEKEEK